MNALVNTAPIGELVTSVRTWNPAVDAPQASFAYIDIASIDRERKSINGAQELKGVDAPSRARQLVRRDDVLVSTVRPNLNGVALVPHELDGATASTGFCVLRANPKKLEPRYLYYWVTSPNFVADMTMKASGQSYPAVSDRIVNESRIPLPPLPEQKRIARILDKADAIRRKRAQSLQLTDQFLQSLFLDMFGDPVTNPKGWREKHLGDLLDCLTSGSRGWAKYYAPQGDLFLRIQNVGQNALLLDDLTYVNAPDSAEAKRTKVEPGDILLSITADLGRTAVVPDGIGIAHINQHLALMRTKDVVPLYLSAFLASEGGQRQFRTLNRNGVKAGLNFDDIRSLIVLVPDKPIQKRYAAMYKRHAVMKSKLRGGVQESESLINSLVQRAFRGEL